MQFPKITIGILISREKYISQTLHSLQRQVYPTPLTQLVLIDNKDNHLTIGQGYNQIVQKAPDDSNWILFLGDDDIIARTYLYCLAVYLRTIQEKQNDDQVKAVTSNLILFSEKKEERIGVDVAPTGMWNKNYLLDQPFDEELPRYVDTEMIARTAELGYIVARDHTNHGYYYRQHDSNVSDNKFTQKTKVLEEIRRKKRSNLEYTPK